MRGNYRLPRPIHCVVWLLPLRITRRAQCYNPLAPSPAVRARLR